VRVGWSSVLAAGYSLQPGQLPTYSKPITKRPIW